MTALTLRCMSNWTLHSSISGSKMTHVKIIVKIRHTVSANHLVRSTYTSFVISCVFSPFWHFHPPFVVIHRPQEYNSHSFLADIADHDKAEEGCLPFAYCGIPTIVSPGVTVLIEHWRKSDLWWCCVSCFWILCITAGKFPLTSSPVCLPVETIPNIGDACITNPEEL